MRNAEFRMVIFTLKEKKKKKKKKKRWIDGGKTKTKNQIYI